MFFFLCMLWENFYLWISYGPPRNTYTGVPRPDSFARMRGVLISWREHFPRSFENLFRAVFTWQSKVTGVYVGFASVGCAIGLKKLAPLFHPIRMSKTRLNRDTLARVFPRFAAAMSIYLEFWLVLCIFYVLFLIGQSDHFGFGFTTFSWKLLYETQNSYFTILFALEFHPISRLPCFTRFCFANAIILTFSSVLLLGSKINWTDICPGDESFGDLLWPFCLIPRNKSWRRFLKYLCEVKVWK